MRYTRVARALALSAALMACGDSENGLFGPGPNDPPPSNALTFEWQGRISAGDHLEIRGINGDIEAVAAAGDRVEVFARKRWGRGDPDEVTFQRVDHADGVTICAVYANPLPGRTNECVPGGGGDTRVGDTDVRVDFEVRIPAEIDLLASLVNGSLDADRVQGDVFAATVNGGLRIVTAGLATAATVNGDIFASLGAADWDRDLAFATVNGNILIELPGTVNADVTAVSVSGRISSDFPLDMDNPFLGNTASGTLGRGGPELDLATVNGDVAIRRR